MTADNKFEAWAAMGTDSTKGNFEWITYEPKKWDDKTDVELKIQYAGICASDLHTASGGWGEVEYPQVVGHEIVGEVLRVGSEVKHLKVGDIAGVGAQSDSCGDCYLCKDHEEPYCTESVGTYNGRYKKGAGKGDKSYGGYANYWRGPGHFTIKIPDGIDPACAAPMMCGGATLYSPLTRYGAGTKAKDVGIVGIGGLGHFGVLFASALGANVTAISHSHSKEEDAKKMGAKNFVATGDGFDFAAHARTLDLIVCTINDADAIPVDKFLSLLRPGGNFVLVGAPEKPLNSFSGFVLLPNVHLTGSSIGSPAQIEEMLNLAAKLDIKPWIEKRPLSSVNKSVVDMENSKARYRYVLVNESNGGVL